MVSVTVVYQGPLGVPVTLAELNDEASIRLVVDRAIALMWNQAAALETAGDAMLAELQRLDATRLDASIAALLPPRPPEPAPAAPQPDDDADPKFVM